MNTAIRPMYKWQDLPWNKIERQVFKLQKRIYQASKRGDIKTVHKLQRLLIKSWYARCLAVRRVTQDNRGKNTAGIDGIKSLNPQQRLKLAQELKLSDKVKPTRRVWIPKPGKDEKRPSRCDSPEGENAFRWVFRRCEIEHNRHSSCSHLNRNGKLSLNQTVTVFVPDVAAMMQSKQPSTPSVTKQNMLLMQTSQNALTASTIRHY